MALTDGEIIERIIKTINKHLPHARIILFGSRASGRHTPRSDFDIAIDVGAPIPLSTMFRIREELDMLPTLKMFDLVDLNSVDERFRRHIMRSGKVLYDGRAERKA